MLTPSFPAIGPDVAMLLWQEFGDWKIKSQSVVLVLFAGGAASSITSTGDIVKGPVRVGTLDEDVLPKLSGFMLHIDEVLTHLEGLAVKRRVA
jgi:hypothetical protein